MRIDRLDHLVLTVADIDEVKGPLPPLDGGEVPFTPRAKASNGGKGPFTHDGMVRE